MSEQKENKPTVKQSPYVRWSISPLAGTENKQLTVFLKNYITDISYYVDILFFLYTAKEGDEAIFYIDNDGGILETGMAIAEAFKATRAKVTTIAISIAASSAALIFTNGHIKIAKPVSFVMYHTASYGAVGKTVSHIATAEYINTLVKNIMTETFKMGLINKEEMRSIVEKGKDLFLDNQTITERISDLNKNISVNDGGSNE